MLIFTYDILIYQRRYVRVKIVLIFGNFVFVFYQGDGGSPLVCPIPIEKDKYFDPDLSMKPQHYVQVGIVSWGIGCAIKDIPAVYANVPFIRTWIDSKIKQFNQSVK